MKKLFRIIPVVLLVAVFAVSCNLPFQPTQAPTGGEAPNLTLTALFDTSLNIPPTITPPGIVTSEPLLPTVSGATYTPQVLATNTAIPPTAQPVSLRAAQLKAMYLSPSPAMDGTYETWVDKSFKYKLPYVVWGANNWSNQADLEGAFAASWDNTYLYVAVKVTDDTYVQNKTGAEMYKGDSIEILIDTNLSGDYYVQSLSADDFQLGVSAGTKATNVKEAYLWYPTAKKGSKPEVIVTTIFEADPTIYRIEAAIPWSLLGITPANGTRIGFAVSINDNDKTGESLQQTMLSTAQNRNFLDPTTWGELLLVK